MPYYVIGRKKLLLVSFMFSKTFASKPKNKLFKPNENVFHFPSCSQKKDEFKRNNKSKKLILPVWHISYVLELELE